MPMGETKAKSTAIFDFSLERETSTTKGTKSTKGSTPVSGSLSQLERVASFLILLPAVWAASSIFAIHPL
jgi:hypothetical protein